MNQRTSGESAFVTTEQWEACYSADVRPLGPGERTELFFGADASLKHDYTALIGTSRSDFTDVRYVKVWKPKKGLFGKMQPIDLEETIGAKVLRLHKLGQVKAVVYDPWQLATVAAQWTKAHVKTIEMPQTAQRVEADTALYNGIVSGSIRHYKNAELDEAVRNAVIVETPRGMRIAKEKASKKIDALVALSMSHHAAIMQPVSGTWQSIPSPFYGQNPDVSEYMEVAGQFVHAPQHVEGAHPPGVTWQTCRKRNKGCLACVAELEAEGYYAAQDEELRLSLAKGAGQPRSAEEAFQDFYWGESGMSGADFAREQYQQQEAADNKIASRFWRTVRADLNNQNKKEQK